MDKKTQERMTNRIMITLGISFAVCIIMYYLYGTIGNGIFNPAATFITGAVIFVALAALMMVKGLKESKKLNLGMVDGYKQSLKARLYFNFEITFVVAAILSLVIYFGGAAWRAAGNAANMASGYSDIMFIIGVALAIYNVALIVWTCIYQAIEKKKTKQVRLSKKATARAELKAKRSKMN